MNETLGKLHFWPTLILMNFIFFPMFFQGLAGVSRRLYDGGITYAHAQDVLVLNKVMSHSAFALAAVQIIFIVNLALSLRRGEAVERNPWNATTLEWCAESPPIGHGNFDAVPAAYRGPYEYSVPDRELDYWPQDEPA